MVIDNGNCNYDSGKVIVIAMVMVMVMVMIMR